jgi:hypothetical protein
MKNIICAFILFYSIVGNAQNDWKVKISQDYKIDIVNRTSVTNEVIMIRFFCNDFFYVKEIEVIEDTPLTLFFPKDFISIKGDSLALAQIQDVHIEFYNKKELEYSKQFLYDPTPNGILQLNPYWMDSTLISKFNIKGNIIKSFQWEDKLKNNIIIFSQLFPDTSHTTLYLYCNHIGQSYEDDSYHLVRTFIDVNRSCDGTLQTKFYVPTISLTDIDRDTIGEFSVIYEANCNKEQENNSNYIKQLFSTNGEKYMQYYYKKYKKKEKYSVTTALRKNELYHRYTKAKMEEFILLNSLNIDKGN